MADTPDIIPVSGETCCMCFDEFEDGDECNVIGCGGHHLLCFACVEKFDHFTDTLAEDGSVLCPVCRGESHVHQICAAVNYSPDGATYNDPIVVD